MIKSAKLKLLWQNSGSSSASTFPGGLAYHYPLALGLVHETCYFWGRIFSGQEFLREAKMHEIKGITFTNDIFSNKFSDKSFHNQEKSTFSREKTFVTEQKCGENTIFYAFSVLHTVVVTIYKV